MSISHEVILQPAGGRFRCEEGQTVLEAALAAGYLLPHSCRAGTCGLCALPLVAGSVEAVSPPPAEAFVPPAGSCLTCQSRPRSDVTLDAPQMGAEPGQRTVTAGARVVAVERPSADVAVLALQVPPAAGFRFQAGQYIDILLRDGARRSYSMANAPDDEGLIELHVRHIPGGRFSEHAYTRLKPRDLLRVEGPFGSFGLRPGDAPIILLASGTGYAPIASMLKTHGDEIRRRGATLYWGGRRLQDLYAVSSVEAWEAAHPGIRFVPVLSEPDNGWQGRTGLVHQAVLDDHPRLDVHEVYACGNPLMIDAARQSFCRDCGLPEHRFFSDAFLPR